MGRRPPIGAGLAAPGRARLSDTFIRRDVLFVDIAAIHGPPNVPDEPDRVIATGIGFCTDPLEPAPRSPCGDRSAPDRASVRRAHP